MSEERYTKSYSSYGRSGKLKKPEWNYSMEISVNDLIAVFRRWFVAMMIAAVVTSGTAYVYDTYFKTPMYESTATLYILRQRGENSTGTDASDFTLALNVVNDCSYLIKSHAVLDKVIGDMNTDITYEDLTDRVTTNNPSGTRVLNITVTDKNPEMAKVLVDRISEAGAEKIQNAMGFQQVSIYEYGTMNGRRSNSMEKKFMVGFGVLAAMAVYLLGLILFVLEDSMSKDNEIEERLGYKIIGSVSAIDHATIAAQRKNRRKAENKH